MKPENFFAKPTDASKRKHEIVCQYFRAYTNVLARNHNVGYADLFAGPGLYDNKEKSVPVLITEIVVASPLLRKQVHLWFNERDKELFERLRANVMAVPGVEEIDTRPVFSNKEAGDTFPNRSFTIPTFLFADPFGISGISLNMINRALSGFGTDCLFFFNYRRLNMKLQLPMMDPVINKFFSAEIAANLRQRLAGLSAEEREDYLLNEISSAIRKTGGLPTSFRFLGNEGGTSHHLVFASRNPRAANMMKRIMSKRSSHADEGVGSFEFDPHDRAARETRPLFSPLHNLEDRLLSTFAGQSLTFADVLERESAQTRYTDTNYRDAILRLEENNRVAANPEAALRRWHAGRERRTLPPDTLLHFPALPLNHGH